MGARRAQRGERFAPGVGWLSAPQQRALVEIDIELTHQSALWGNEASGWVFAPKCIHHATLSSLERMGLVEVGYGVRLTEEGTDVVRRWQEADA